MMIMIIINKIENFEYVTKNKINWLKSINDDLAIIIQSEILYNFVGYHAKQIFIINE